MAKARKDNRGRALEKGESQRKSNLSYIYSYNDPFGNRKFIVSKDLATLRKKKQRLIKDQLDGLDVYLAGKASLNFVFDRYISTKSELRSTTRTNYTYMYDHFVREKFGQKKIGSIKYSEVLWFYNYLLDDLKLQVNTLEVIHTVLHPTFELAVRDEIIRSNPSKNVMREMKKMRIKEKNTRHALTLKQQQAFMMYVNDSPVYWKWKPILTVLLGTGCRVGEIIGLRWSDLDFEQRTISINHSMTYYQRQDEQGEKTCGFEVSLPKTKAGIRLIPMFGKVYEVLKELYEVQEEEGFNDLAVYGMTGFIFFNRFGNLCIPAAINRAIKRIYESHNLGEILDARREKREAVLIPHISCHHLRHTFCTRFCEHETDVKVIQMVMGHAQFETTMDIYTDVTEVRKKDSMKKLVEKIDIF